MTRPNKFPEPNEFPAKWPAVLCPRKRIKALFNESHKDNPAKSISLRVQTWFVNEAHTKGWVGVRFLPQIPTGVAAGAILWPAARVQVSSNITPNTLVLVSETEDDFTVSE